MYDVSALGCVRTVAATLPHLPSGAQVMLIDLNVLETGRVRVDLSVACEHVEQLAAEAWGSRATP